MNNPLSPAMMPDIVDKQEILIAIENALLNGLWRVPQGLDVSDEDRDETKEMVTCFIAERLSLLNVQELLEQFDTTEKIFNSYSAYLETRLEIGSATVH